MTATTNSTAATADQKAPMSESTRIAVSLAMALGVLCFVLLMSYSGPVFHAIGAWIDGRAAAMLRFSRLPAVSYEMVTRCLLLVLYAAVLFTGMAHAKRTRVALEQRRPKNKGKPKVGSAPGWALTAVLTAWSLAGAMFSLFQMDPHVATTGDILGFTVCGAITPLIAIGIFLAVVCHEGNVDPSCAGTIRIAGVLPALVAVVMGYSAMNVGLLLGLWTMMLMLKPLESKELPASYPDHFDVEPVTLAVES